MKIEHAKNEREEMGRSNKFLRDDLKKKSSELQLHYDSRNKLRDELQSKEFLAQKLKEISERNLQLESFSLLPSLNLFCLLVKRLKYFFFSDFPQMEV